MIERHDDRRSFLRKVGIGTAVAWTAPVVFSSAAQAQGSPAPLWMAVGGDGTGRNFTSIDDGATWVAGGPAVPGGGEMHAVAYSPLGDRWISVGRDLVSGATAIFTSDDDGATWSTFNPTPTGRLLGIATDGAGTWVAVGQTVTTYPGNHLIVRSTDNGNTWIVDAAVPVLNQLHGIATDRNGRWVAVGQNNAVRGVVLVSTDNGATWDPPVVLDNTDDALVIGIATDGGGRWIAGGSFTNHSPEIAALWEATGNNLSNPSDWTPNTSIGNGFVYGVASDRSGTFVAVGHHTSPSSVPFSLTIGAGIATGTFPPGAIYQLHEVATDRSGTWITVGFDGPGGPMRSYTSFDDGLNWTITSSPSPDGILLGVAPKVLE